MKVTIDQTEYSVYWKHHNNGKGKKSRSICFISCKEVDTEFDPFLITGEAVTHPSDNFNRKLGMKISFARAVARIAEKEVRATLWGIFRATTKPKQPTYYYKGKPYRIKEFSKVKSTTGWFPVVIYEALYHNPDGKTWVRGTEDFFSKFYTKEYEGIEEEIQQVQQQETEQQDQQILGPAFDVIDQIPEELPNFNYNEEN